MLNQKAIFKQKSKSKIFLIILCIFGLLFSYSCSCRNRVTGPGNDGLENGKNPEPETGGGNIITPSMSLSRDLMVVNSAGDKTTYDITITVADADFEIADITSEVGLTKDDFTLANGVLSLTKSFDKVDTTEKTLTLTVNYKKKSTAGANDTLSKTTDTQTFKVVKATALSDEDIQNEMDKMLTVGNFEFSSLKISSGVMNIHENEAQNNDIYTSDFIKNLNDRIIEKRLDIITSFDCIKVELSQDSKTATFSFILKVKEQYETTYNSANNPLKIKIVIGDTQGGTGTWKDTFTPQS